MKQALQFVFDTNDDSQIQAKKQAELNQVVANGFEIIACPVVGTKIYYQLYGQQQKPKMTVKRFVDWFWGIK